MVNSFESEGVWCEFFERILFEVKSDINMYSYNWI